MFCIDGICNISWHNMWHERGGDQQQRSGPWRQEQQHGPFLYSSSRWHTCSLSALSTLLVSLTPAHGGGPLFVVAAPYYSEWSEQRQQFWPRAPTPSREQGPQGNCLHLSSTPCRLLQAPQALAAPTLRTGEGPCCFGQCVHFAHPAPQSYLQHLLLLCPVPDYPEFLLSSVISVQGRFRVANKVSTFQKRLMIRRNEEQRKCTFNIKSARSHVRQAGYWSPEG